LHPFTWRLAIITAHKNNFYTQVTFAFASSSSFVDDDFVIRSRWSQNVTQLRKLPPLNCVSPHYQAAYNNNFLRIASICVCLLILNFILILSLFKPAPTGDNSSLPPRHRKSRLKKCGWLG
jgi:hypothetical protein